MGPPRQARFELRKAHEDERQQRLGVPLVVHEDVQVGEHVGVEQVRLVEEKDGVQLVAVQVLHMRLDGEEEVGGGRRRIQAEGVAKVSVEVASPEGGIAAVGESEAALREPVAQHAQYARLADAGLAEEQDALPLRERLLDFVDEQGLGLWQPELLVVDLLAEGDRAKVEVREEINRSHRRPPRRR